MVLSLKNYVVFTLLFTLFPNAEAGELKMIPAIKELSDNMLKNYSRYILPTETGPFNITIEADILALGDIDEIEEKLSSVFWFYYFWKDESINWDVNQTNVEWISLGYNDVWAPVLRVANPHIDESKGQKVDRSYDIVIYNSTGDAYYDEMMTTRTTCDLDLTYYPFDIQNCSVDLMILGKNNFYFDLDVSLHKTFSKEDAEHGSWRLLGTHFEVGDGSFSIILIFERKPLFLLINILLPIIVLALLTPVVFLLPKDSGERVGYGITMLLAISVYMIIVSENLPNNSQPMPLISIMIFIWYVLDAIIVFVVIINTKIHLMTNTAPLPCYARYFVLLTEKMTSCVTCKVCRNKASGEKSPGERETCIELNAEDNKEIDVKSSDTENHMTSGNPTWQDVSKSIDKWSFVVSYLLKITLPTVFLIIVKTQ